MNNQRTAAFKLAIRTPDGCKIQSAGECSDTAAFALHMVLVGGDEVTKEGAAGEFQAARLAYLDAAAKYYASLTPQTKGAAS